jgi:hypothetical protein
MDIPTGYMIQQWEVVLTDTAFSDALKTLDS